MENLLTFSAVRVHSDVGKDVFSFDSRSFGCAQVGVTFACDLILHAEMHRCGAGTCFFTFLAHMALHSQKRNTLISLSLRQSHTDYMCSSSLNDAVNAPHQRMSHSTTLLLWWFLPSVYYIMQQRVLLSYIHHNKHSPKCAHVACVNLAWIIISKLLSSLFFFFWYTLTTAARKKRCFFWRAKLWYCPRVPEVAPWFKGQASHVYFTLTWILHAIRSALRNFKSSYEPNSDQ